MGYVEDNLIAGETVLYRTRLHWIVLIGPMLLAIVIGAGGIVLMIHPFATNGEQTASIAKFLGIGLIVTASVILGWGMWHRSSTEMAVTNKRVSIKVGMISRNTTEMMLTKIESVAVHQGVMGRMLSFGTIIIRGTGGTPEPFPKIGHPLEFRRQVQQQLDKMQSLPPASAT